MADSSLYIAPFCVDFADSNRPEIRFDTLVIEVPDDSEVDPGERLTFVFSEFDTTNIVERLRRAHSNLDFDTRDCDPARKLRIAVGYSLELVPVVYISYPRERGETRSSLVGKYTYSFEEARWREYDDSDHNLWYWFSKRDQKK